MELQHVNVKLPLADPEGLDLEPLIPIFHSWIQDKIFEERLLDIADYRHVHNGPGVVLIGHEGDYAVDNTDGHLGVRYNRKAALEGSNRDRLKQAARAALNGMPTFGSGRLASEGNFALTVRMWKCSLTTACWPRIARQTREAARPDFQAFSEELFRGADYSSVYGSDPRRLFSVSLRASRAFSLADLLTNLQS